jgi:hypothetical protein
LHLYLTHSSTLKAEALRYSKYLPNYTVTSQKTVIFILRAMRISYRTRCSVLSRERVIVDGVWVGDRIYWTLQRTTRDYTSQITITHRLVFSVTVFTALLVNDFQQWSFHFSRAGSSQAGDHLTPISHSSNCHLRPVP